jgi:hypothetical protein
VCVRGLLTQIWNWDNRIQFRLANFFLSVVHCTCPNWIIDTYINVLDHPVPNDAGVSTTTSDGNIEDEEDSDKEYEYNEHSEMEEDVEKSDCDVDYSPENEFNEAETDFEYVFFSLHQY